MQIKKINLTVLLIVAIFSLGILIVKAEENRGLKAKVEARFENKDVRNIKLENREEKREILASTTEKIRDLRASTTMMFKNLNDKKKEVIKKMELRTYEIRKNALVKELTNSLKNLDNIKARIDEKISRAEASGRNMTEAKASLVIAVDKMAKAKVAVDAFASFSYLPNTATTTNTIASSTVDLVKPRKMGDDAIKAVKEARDALKKVVELIAKNMGKGDDRATSTPSAVLPN